MAPPVNGSALDVLMGFACDKAFDLKFSTNFLRPNLQEGQISTPVQDLPLKTTLGPSWQPVPARIDSIAEAQICSMCHLPIGDFGYANDTDERALIHGECKVQHILQDKLKEEEICKEKDAAVKKRLRAEYNIGWKTEHVPCNLVPANKLGCSLAQQSMCCLVLAEDSRSIRLAPTTDPAASVNLEYLSLALRVRKFDGGEPVFSLDPKEVPKNPSNSVEWQVKRFEPNWLSGTSLGEVMFQADIYLKELSMGEYAQPIVGMKSSFEFAEEAHDLKWSAREWFVVKEAEIHLSQGNALISNVKMGVEAREQMRRGHGLEDAPVTRPDHPLVKYAEAFTHYFDLIAERKSVVYHLREVAKVSVLAKFLVEAEIGLEDTWFNLASASSLNCCLEIPQLWNTCRHSQIHAADGKIMGDGKGVNTRVHGVYGGVQFGLERARLSAPALTDTATLADSVLLGVPVPKGAMLPLKVQNYYARGVDLNLDKFDLSDTLPSPNALGAMSNKEHQQLLKDIFHPCLSDRCGDGCLFLPSYAQRLQELVKEENISRSQRKNDFFSDNSKHARPDYEAEASFYLLQAVAPTYEQRTEDGTKFRIYNVGSMEFRTIQEHKNNELIGAVFSGLAPMLPQAQANEWSVVEHEKIVKITQYVESCCNALTKVSRPHYYIMIETDTSNVIVTEQLEDHRVAWALNPLNLEVRNSLAKVFRALQCHGLTIRDMKNHQAKEAPTKVATSCCDGRYYAQSIYGQGENWATVTPGWEKKWDQLTQVEKHAAVELGVRGRDSWQNGAWVRCEGWRQLSKERQAAAGQLGFNEDTWNKWCSKDFD